MSDEKPATDYGDHYNPEDFTVEVKLRFRNEDAMGNFLAGLSDGWGEGEVDLHWPWRQGMKFHECQTFCVDVQNQDQTGYIGVDDELDISEADFIAITKMFQWRDERTDHYGDDLISTIMAAFSSDPDISHHNRKDIPEEHQAGLKVFRALSYDAQYKLVEAFVGKQ